MFVGYEQVVVDNHEKTQADLTIPANTTKVMLQAGSGEVRYTMDLSKPTQTIGMVLHPSLAPEEFLIEDLKRIRFTKGSAANTVLNIHYWTGRDV